MAHSLRTFLHTFVPSHFDDLWGLAFRVIRSRNPAGRFAMQNAFLGILLTPLDLLLSIAETKLYKKASKSKLPLIFVCGAPRSGTTLVSQVLIAHLPVCYINNLTALFPRSPIVGNLLFRKTLGQKALAYSSYYGKTLHFSGPNDALYIWDRWFGMDRTRIPSALSLSDQEKMIRFFGAYERVFQRPVLNKNNSLDTCASLIAPVLENSYFLCMTRDPLYLAQSLLRARTDIHGDIHTPYGVAHSNQPRDRRKDYVEDVCEQVLFHEEKMREQQRVIGSERFWTVSYEGFCKAPHELVKQVSERILKQPVDVGQLTNNLKPFENTNRPKETEAFKKIEETLSRLRRTKRQPPTQDSI